MSRRIQRKSVRSSQRIRQSIIVTSDDAYSYALRTAFLHYLLLPRPRRQVPAPPPPQQISRASTSWGDLMRDFSHTHGDPKSIRFPKDFLSALQKRLELVIMGKDNHIEFKDAIVKRTFGNFYGSFMEPGFYNGVAKSRRPEDLLLIFYSSATKEIQRVKQDDSWKPLVDRHVALFVRLMHSIIKEHGWSSVQPELATRLADLEKKLLRHDENLSNEGGQRASRMILAPPEPLSYNVQDMPMVKIVSRVFQIPLETCQMDINRNKTIWTEKAAVQDMKAYTINLNLNTKRTLRSEDFDLDEAYEAWKKAETPELSKLMLSIIQANPELAKTTSAMNRRPGHAHTVSSYSAPGQSNRSSIYSTSTSSSSYNVADVDAMSLSNGSSVEDDDTPYIYIPPDPRVFYRHLVDRCLTYDLNDPELLPLEIPEVDPVLLLSKNSIDLLDQCALRWRVPKFSRMVLFLDAIRSKYQEQEIDLDTLDGAFMYFKTEVQSNPFQWTIADQNMFRQILSTVHDFVLRELYDVLQHAYDAKAKPIGTVMWVLDQHIYSEDLFQVTNMESYKEQLKEGLRLKAEEVLEGMFEELPQDRPIDPLDVVELTQKVIKLAEKVSKRFKQPVLDTIVPMMIFIEIVFPKFATEIRNVVIDIIKASRERGEEMEIEDGFELYRELSEIRRIYQDAFPEKQFPVHFEEFLADFVWRWIQTVDQKVIGWVDAAIKEDDFILKIREEEGREPTDNERHTSSVVDIFRSFNQPVDYLKKLDWGDQLQYAKFMTTMSKILGKGVSRYCEILEKLFTYEMDKPSAEQEIVQAQTRQQRWMSMAREAWSNKDKIEPFQFAPECCVKLNNIEFAIQQFDKLEHAVDADSLAEIVARYSPPVPQRTRNSYVFTIKIIEAEDLKAMDINGYSDPYVVLGDEYQKRLAKTRIVYSNLNPRWEESFDITAQGPVWLTATLWDWDTVGDHDCLGRTNIKLDPAHFMDFLPKEFWLDLDTQGRLLLRVSMEGERDDIQFHFGKAFRTLKRTERDMTRQITDKLSAYIHHCLSRSALKSVIGKGYNMSAVSNLFGRTGLGNARPQSGITGAITEADIASAIVPLTDYFNDNFAILNQTLTSTAMTLVMSKLWKEVLTTIELLLVPTLSDKPSQQQQLTQQQTEIVYKWLQMMFDFFHAADENGQATGVPMDVLKSPKYHELQSLNFFYFDETESLIRISGGIANNAAARQQEKRKKLMGTSSSAVTSGGLLGVPGGAKRSKSVLNKRNLGTMRKAKEEKRREAQAEPNDDMILRILRMRPEAAGYLKDRSRQKERLEAAAAAEAIVRQSVNQSSSRMAPPRR
ncbi:hypothetical protein EDC01DRAFT_194231 [Geopyxis carbonaria]|nr:hypothetical protein EDC01DRAFT_194231 [Geopyxis carbonaria]